MEQDRSLLWNKASSKLIVAILLAVSGFLLGIGVKDVLARQKQTQDDVVELKQDVATLKATYKDILNGIERVEASQNKIIDLHLAKDGK